MLISPEELRELLASKAEEEKPWRGWQSKADAHPHPYFREGYAEMRRAFEAGADGGAVDFR